MAYKRIKQLTTSGQSGNIKVKVITMWESINFATDELMSLDMILMDEQVHLSHYNFIIKYFFLFFLYMRLNNHHHV